MTKAIFTFSEGSGYDDKPEERYHFPRTYLKQVEAAVGDFVVYYEPRRDQGFNSSGGRKAYFAAARVKYIEADTRLDGHYYAAVDEYLPFDHPVPFQGAGFYYETALLKDDGTTGSFWPFGEVDIGCRV